MQKLTRVAEVSARLPRRERSLGLKCLENQSNDDRLVARNHLDSKPGLQTASWGC